MNSFRFRMWMGLSTCASLLVFLVGCPAPQHAPSPTAPPAVISKADLDAVRHRFVHELHPAGAPEVRNGEIMLVDFHQSPDRVRARLYEAKADLERLVRNKRGSRIFDEQMRDNEFSFKYEHNGIHGHVSGQLVRHEHREPHHWDIILRVNEHPR